MQVVENPRLNFPIAEYRRRYEAVTRRMKEERLDAVFTRNMDHICYLTGYEDPHVIMYHALLVLSDGPVFFARRYELSNVREFTWLPECTTIEDLEHPAEAVATRLLALGLGNKRIGIERGMRTAGMFCGLEEFELLRSRLPDATFVNALEVIPSVRVIKSDAEIEAMREAARIAESAVESAIGVLEPGCSENDVAAEYLRAAVKGGSEYPSLTPFMVSGRRTSLPHGTWRGRIVEPGDPFLFECSANHKRYEVPVMRTVNVGEPSARVKAMAAAEIEALNVGIAAVKPGMTGEEVHRIIYGIMDRHGFGGEHYKHPSAYSIGLSLPPAWSETHYMMLREGETKRLEPNMTFHVVPISLIDNEVGVGFSAAVRVTEQGGEALTRPRALTII